MLNIVVKINLFFQRHEPSLEMRARCQLSFEGFALYLMDKDNYAFVPEDISPKEDVCMPSDCH